MVRAVTHDFLLTSQHHTLAACTAAWAAGLSACNQTATPVVALCVAQASIAKNSAVLCILTDLPVVLASSTDGHLQAPIQLEHTYLAQQSEVNY